MAQATAERARRNSPPPPQAPPETDPPVNGAAAGAETHQAPAAEREADPFVFMNNFSSDDWRFLQAYVYRTAPIINKRGGEVNIGVYTNAFDQSEIMKTHGSGDYRIDVVQDSPEGGKRRRIRQFYFSIFHPDHPPKIPLGEWADDPRNEKWAWAKASTANGVTGQTSNTGMNPEALIRLVLDAVEKARPNVSKEDQTNLAGKIVSMVENNQAKLMEMADPSKQMQKVRELIDAVNPPGKGKDDPLYAMLLEDRRQARDEAKAERESNAKLIEKLLNRPEPPAPKGFLEQLIENEPALTRVRSFFGGGNTTPRTDWGQVVSDIGARLIEGIAPVAVALINRANAGAAAGQPGAPSWPPKKPKQVAAAKATAEEPEAAEAAAAAEPELEMPEGVTLTAAEQAQLMNSLQKYGAVIQQSIPFMVDQYRAGLSGYEFRDWFLSRHGLNWWTAMKGELKTEGLILAAKYDPELWKALQPESKARVFFTEFFTEPEEEELPGSEFSSAEGTEG